MCAEKGPNALRLALVVHRVEQTTLNWVRADGSNSASRAQGVSRHADANVLEAMNQMIDELGGCQEALHKFRDAAIFMKGGMGRDRVAFLVGLSDTRPVCRVRHDWCYASHYLFVQIL